jgi:hypothetical protein
MVVVAPRRRIVLAMPDKGVSFGGWPRVSYDNDLARSLGLTTNIDKFLGARAVDERQSGQLDLSLENVQLYAEYRRLAEEQAALRRLAALVARGVEPSEVFDAVVKEMRRCLLAERAGLWRYEPSDEVTLIAADYGSEAPVGWPVGTRTPIGDSTLAAMVRRTGRPARMDSYENSVGLIAARVRWAYPSSWMDGCGAWRLWVRLNPVPCRPTPRSASVASPN